MKSIQLLNINLDEFEEIIESKVREALKSGLGEPTTIPKYLNQKEAAQYLRISPPTFRALGDKLKSLQVSHGRKVYLRSDLDEYLQSLKGN